MSTQKQSIILRAGLDVDTLRQIDEKVTSYRQEIASADITDKMAGRALEHQLALWKQENRGNEKSLSYCLFELLTVFSVRFVRQHKRPVVCNELMELMPRIEDRIAVLYLHMDPQFKAPTRFGNCVPVEGMPSGSQAAVYRVRDSTGKLRVAKAAVKDTPEANALRQEKAILTTLDEIPLESGARFARVTEYGRNTRGVYLIVEHIAGTTLEKIVANRTLPTPYVAEIALQVAATLREVHNRAILHLDVSPRNIIVSDPLTAPVATLIDFGTSAELDVANRTVANPAGIGKGTPGYASPEVACGQSCSVRSDIYSLAAVCLTALADVIPSQDEEIAIFSKDATYNSRRFLGILQKATSNDPKQRHKDAIDFLDAVTPFAISSIKARRKRTLKVTGYVAIASTVVLLLFMAFRQNLDPVQGRAPSVRTWLDDKADEIGFSLSKIRRDDFRVTADFKNAAMGNLPDTGFIYANYDKELAPFARGLEGRLGDGPWRQLGEHEGAKVFTVKGVDILDGQEFSLRLDSVPGPVEGVVAAGPYTYSVDLQSIQRSQMEELRADATTISKSGLSGDDLILHAGGWVPASFLIQRSSEVDQIKLLFEGGGGRPYEHVLYSKDRDIRNNEDGTKELTSDAIYRVFRDLPRFVNSKAKIFAAIEFEGAADYPVGVLTERSDNLFVDLDRAKRNKVAESLFEYVKGPGDKHSFVWSDDFVEQNVFLTKSVDISATPDSRNPGTTIPVHLHFVHTWRKEGNDVDSPASIRRMLGDSGVSGNASFYVRVNFLNRTSSDYILKSAISDTSNK